MAGIKLRSCDGDTIEVDRDLVKTFGTLSHMFKNCPAPSDNDEAVVTLPNVSGLTLRRVLKWVEYHQGDPKPSEGEVSNHKPPNKSKYSNVTFLSSWDQDFFTVRHCELFELILAADYLDIKNLMDHSCQFVANMMAGKSPEQIRQIFQFNK